jgi:hypothetical protein
MDWRTFPGVALLPTNSGAVQFLNLETMTVVTRNNFQPVVAVPKSYVDFMNKLSDLNDEQVNEILGVLDNGEPDSDDESFDADENLGLDPDAVAAFSLTAEESADRYGRTETLQSALSEMSQLLRQGVIKGIKADEVVHPSELVPSKIFFKGKQDSEGRQLSLKGRFVAGGHRQNRDKYESGVSKTVSIPFVLTIATIAAHKNMIVCTYDVPGAYLWADRIGTKHKIYVRLDQFTTEMLCIIDAEWHKYVRQNGTSVAEVKKALYGLIESAHLWYLYITKYLISLGFHKSNYDECVFLKQGMTIALYVDDMFIVSESNDNVTWLETNMINKFGGKFNRLVDDSIEFIGMKFRFKEAGVEVSMRSKLEDLTAHIESSKKVDSPAGLNLLTIDEDSPLLGDKERESFHSTTAKLLYVTSRVRPDLCLAVNFLTSRVKHPTLQDATKLNRLLVFLKHTIDETLFLKVGKTVHVHSYVDAAYGVHPDMKSHTGMNLCLGDAKAIMVKSTKQRIVSKSSTEAELVAASDCTGDLLQLNEFIKELKVVDCNVATLYQDNQATIALLKNGVRNTGRSKHINIRVFWLKERIERGELIVEYMPTQEMIADGLTKPLQGSNYRKFMDMILGKNPGSARSVLEN